MAYDRIKCPNCSVDFGQELRFLDHLTDVHGIDDHEQLYVNVVLNGIKPTCNCGCNEDVSWSGWKKGYTSKFKRGHNAIVDSVYLNPQKQAEFAKKRHEGYASGQYSTWNKGLTKETSEKVATTAKKISSSLKDGYKSGTIIDWHIKDPGAATAAATKMSDTKKKKFQSGELSSWNKGLTKESDERVASVSNIIKNQFEAGHVIPSKRLSSDEFLSLILKQKTFSLVSDPSTYKNKYVKFDFKCNTCGKISKKNLMMIKSVPVCFNCHPKESKAQIEIYDYVRSLAPDAVLSDRTVISPKEIDVFVPSKKFGIEYDGLYWHSEIIDSDKKRSQKKHDAALNAGIKLLHIFEDEWRDKQELVKSMIAYRLGTSSKVIGARKCEVKVLTVQQRKQFMNANHLENDCNSSASWGLFYNGELVSALSLRRPFHARYRDAYEVGRFCNLMNITVPGALSKLLKVAIAWAKSKGAARLLSYVDLRIGDGSGYEKAGFKLISSSSPRFWWTDYKNRLNRFAVKADASSGLTQIDAAKNAGVVAIWGCGNQILELNIEEKSE
jgi:hypothetical protein